MLRKFNNMLWLYIIIAVGWAAAVGVLGTIMLQNNSYKKYHQEDAEMVLNECISEGKNDCRIEYDYDGAFINSWEVTYNAG